MRLALLIIILAVLLVVLVNWKQCEPREGMHAFYLDPSNGQRMPVTICKEVPAL